MELKVTYFGNPEDQWPHPQGNSDPEFLFHSELDFVVRSCLESWTLLVEGRTALRSTAFTWIEHIQTRADQMFRPEVLLAMYIGNGQDAPIAVAGAEGERSGGIRGDDG